MDYREQFRACLAYYELSTCISMLEPWEKYIAHVILLNLGFGVAALVHCTMLFLGLCMGAVLVAIDRMRMLDYLRYSVGSDYWLII